MTRRRRPSIAVVGAGRLAAAWVPLLADAGYTVTAIAARTSGSARRLCRKVRGARPAASPEAAAASAAILLLALPDQEIAPTARRLAAAAGIDWRRKTVLHHAGALGPSSLTALARRGASVGVLHPLQVLGLPEIAREILPGSRARIEGDPRAVRVARLLAADLGLVPVRFPGTLDASGRAAWHAAASLASNDLVALLSLAAGALRATGLDEREALRALLPLARGTLAHLAAGGIEGALTGPVARADARTLASQLRTLGERSAEAEALHRALSRRLLRIAAAAGHLGAAEQAALRHVLASSPRGRRAGRGV